MSWNDAAMSNIQSNILRWKQNSSFYSGLFTALLNKDDIITCSYSKLEIIYPVVLNKWSTGSISVFVSTEAVDTMDLARVRRRRRSVVRDFTVTALQSTVFYPDLLYLQVMFSLRKILPGNIFGLILKNKMAARAVFPVFSWIFFILLQFLNFQEKLTTIRGWKYCYLSVCVCTGLVG